MTIERALARRGQWQEGTRLDSWMYRIMRNIFIDEARANSRRRETFVPDEAGLAIGAEGGQEVHHLHVHVMGGPRPWLRG
mgnify:CR=1 FL=1